jgi:Ca2+/H+ antiporter
MSAQPNLDVSEELPPLLAHPEGGARPSAARPVGVGRRDCASVGGMVTVTRSPLFTWTTVLPVVALAVLAATWGRKLPLVLAVIVALVLAGAVLSAVHHAEVVAHRVGEPFGSLVLAVAVTVIEVALIVTLMVSGGPETATLARDTVFAAVMITCNGIVGLSLLLGARRYGLSVFNAEGSGAALATVATVATLSLVLPTSPPAGEARSSRRPSWPSPRSPRSCCTRRSC